MGDPGAAGFFGTLILSSACIIPIIKVSVQDFCGSYSIRPLAVVHQPSEGHDILARS